MVSSRALLSAATVLLAGVLVPATGSTAHADLPSGCAQPMPGDPVTCTFDYTGGDQTFTVPAGVSSVSVTEWGGHGAGANNQAGGGRGALVSGTFAVAPGDQLTIAVAGDGGIAGGGFGFGQGGGSPDSTTGGGGGGASAVSTADTWLLVAGGGGGMGESTDVGDCGFGGGGGDAGHDGTPGTNCTVPGGVAGVAGASVNHNGASSATGFYRDGGGGGGGVNGGGAGGGSNLINSNLCCSPAGGGGGGTSGADPSGTEVSLGGLSDRGQGQNGLVQIEYTPLEFTSGDTASFTRGAQGSFAVTTAGSPTPAISVTGALSAGLHLLDNGDGTATLSGTPTGRPGKARVTLHAQDAVGSTSQSLRIVVVPLPGKCANRFEGTEGSDRLQGTSAGDRLVAHGGSDTLLGFAKVDCLSAGAGNDALWGDRGKDVLWGGHGADVLRGGPARDLIIGGSGRDVVWGGSGSDIIHVHDGQRDVIHCGLGNDFVLADPVDVVAGCEHVSLRFHSGR